MLRASAFQACVSLRHAPKPRAEVILSTARRNYEASASYEEERANGVLRRRQSPYKSLCKLTLIGRTGAVPEIRTFDDGSSVLSISVATTHPSSNKMDANQDTQWHNVSISQTTPGFSFFEQLPVGSQLYVEGLLRIKTVERDGEKRQYVNVNVSQGFGMVRVLSTPRGAGMDAERELQDKNLPF
ncbi:Single-strand binding protein [Gracilaria domingensis]|nr:Single-strand binding protein [Gracilaria domingensis]